jgi:lipid II:glycine glycyltransferase (peptidoglycan interpeptide bridge formation enzyme)
MGLKTYDFLGISPDNNKDHPWYGVTEFKLKFGGEKIDYASPQEYSFKKLIHVLYKLIKK